MEGNFRLFTNVFKICSGFYVLTFVATQMVLCANQIYILPKTCTIAGSFRVSFGKSIEACIDECQRRHRCEIVMYKHGINECSLKDFINITTLTEEEPICLFTNINDLERIGLGPCDKNSCGITETCVTSSTDQNRFECVKSECSKPQAINNARLLSNMNGIGHKNCYKCDQNYIGEGNPFVTCVNNCTWTLTDFKCIRTGRKPASNLEIADIISVVGEEWLEGTRVNFACRPGYQGLGLNATSVIDSKGNWSPRIVQCCNENITQHIWGYSCFQTFNGSFATEVTDMGNLCIEKGGLIRGIDPSLAKKVFEQEDYSWLLSAARKQNFVSYLEKCFQRNKVFDVLENFSNYTYLELIDEVVNRDLTQPWECSTAVWWAPDEPNGGDAEECVLFRNGTNDIVDVDCSPWMFYGRSDVGFICYYGLPQI